MPFIPSPHNAHSGFFYRNRLHLVPLTKNVARKRLNAFCRLRAGGMEGPLRKQLASPPDAEETVVMLNQVVQLLMTLTPTSNMLTAAATQAVAC